MGSLLSEIELFIASHDLSEWQLGEGALNDRRFVKELRRGRRVWPETEAKVRAFMLTYASQREAA